jgi:hypothetical protein
MAGKANVNHLPVLVSGEGIDQLLKFHTCRTREITAAAIVAAIEDWGMRSGICGMAFDTKSWNTGLKSGSCNILEEKLDKRLLSFACRHHILECLLTDISSYFWTICSNVSNPPGLIWIMLLSVQV